MFNHVMIGSNDLARSKAFYDAVLGAMGAPPGVQDPKGRLIYAHRGGRLMVTTPIDGNPATGANGGTIGFAVESTDEGDAWHKAGVENGGTAVEDAPGLRGGPQRAGSTSPTCAIRTATSCARFTRPKA